MKKITSYITKRAAGRIVIRCFGFPAAAAAGIYSAYQTWKSHKNLKEFNAKHIAPLKQESDKWENARSQLEGSVHELTYYERCHYPHTRYADPGAEPNLEIILEDDEAENQQNEIVERHYPDTVTAYDLVVRAKQTLAECSDKRGSEILEMLEPIETKLYAAKETKSKNKKYKSLRTKISKVVEKVKYVISDYQYDISKLKKERKNNKWKWGLATAASIIGAAVGIKGLKDVTTKK